MPKQGSTTPTSDVRSDKERIIEIMNEDGPPRSPVEKAQQILGSRVRTKQPGTFLIDGYPGGMKDLVRVANERLAALGIATKLVYPGI
jgi:hypothetical protein